MPLQPLPDYSIGLPDPAETARKNAELAMNVAQVQQRNQLVDIQAQEYQLKVQEAQRKQALESKLEALGPTPTPQAIWAITSAHPELTDNLLKGYAALDAEDQKAQLSVAQKVHMASLGGHPDIAQKVLLDEATANENSGNKKRAEELRTTADQIEKNPGATDALIGGLILRVKGGDEYLKTFGQVAANRKAEADASGAVTDAAVKAKFGSLQAQASLDSTRAATASSRDAITDRAAGRSLAEKEFELKKADSEAKKNELSAEALKEINGHANAADEADVAARKAGNLADLFAKLPESGSGSPARFIESVKRITGREDGYTALLQQLNQLRNETTLSSLKGLGRITEKEIEMVQRGLPEGTGNPKLVEQWLRVLQKKNQFDAETRSAKADWMTENRGNLAAPAAKSFIAAGRAVLPGDTFAAVLRLTPAQANRRAQLMREAAKP